MLPHCNIWPHILVALWESISVTMACMPLSSTTICPSRPSPTVKCPFCSDVLQVIWLSNKHESVSKEAKSYKDEFNRSRSIPWWCILPSLASAWTCSQNVGRKERRKFNCSSSYWNPGLTLLNLLISKKGTGGRHLWFFLAYIGTIVIF